MKVAIVHDWLTTFAGAERVLSEILACYPEADLYCIVDFMPEGQRGFLQTKPVTTSFIQNLPYAKSSYRQYLILMPLAVEQFDLSRYDLIISSSHAVAKGVLTGPDQTHVCMCYSPLRYAWDLQHQHLTESGLDKGTKGWIAKLMLHKMRIWDTRTANGVDEFAAISHFVARRIWKTYRRRSRVIYPPVDLSLFVPGKLKENFYVTVSRMVPYKKIDLIVAAFSEMPGKTLVVIGDGPDFKKIDALRGANVQLVGYQPIEKLVDYLQRAKAFVFSAEEDFGIAPLEAQACGTPVVAYKKGGVTETLQGLDKEHPTAVFFETQSIAALKNAIAEFEQAGDRFNPAAIRENVMRFSPERFKQEFVAFVEESLHQPRLNET